MNDQGVYVIVAIVGVLLFFLVGPALTQWFFGIDKIIRLLLKQNLLINELLNQNNEKKNTDAPDN